MAVGLENMRLITRSVLATNPFRPVRFRVAQVHTSLFISFVMSSGPCARRNPAATVACHDGSCAPPRLLICPTPPYPSLCCHITAMLAFSFIMQTGIASRITALQEFCMIACVGVFADFVLQVPTCLFTISSLSHKPPHCLPSRLYT